LPAANPGVKHGYSTIHRISASTEKKGLKKKILALALKLTISAPLLTFNS